MVGVTSKSAPHIEWIEVDGIAVEVVRKSVKNIRLSVHGPAGNVRLSVPRRVKDNVIKQTISTKLEWIRKQQARFLHHPAPLEYSYVSGEMHMVWGTLCRLEWIERRGMPVLKRAEHDNTMLLLYAPADSPTARREAAMRHWYRQQLKNEIPLLIKKWEPVIGVKVLEWGVKSMRTRWGSCNINAQRIWLGTELAKKPYHCLEYVVVHEMVHLLERYHNVRFHGFMSQFLPDWQHIKAELNGKKVP